jgi:hypothetical protein
VDFNFGHPDWPIELESWKNLVTGSRTGLSALAPIFLLMHSKFGAGAHGCGESANAVRWLQFRFNSILRAYLAG